jgi:hypothetical protein
LWRLQMNPSQPEVHTRRATMRPTHHLLPCLLALALSAADECTRSGSRECVRSGSDEYGSTPSVECLSTRSVHRTAAPQQDGRSPQQPGHTQPGPRRTDPSAGSPRPALAPQSRRRRWSHILTSCVLAYRRETVISARGLCARMWSAYQFSRAFVRDL